LVPPARRDLRANGDDEAPLRGLLDPVTVDDAADADRRGGADRRSRLSAPRPRPPGPTRRAPPARRGRLRADERAPADLRRAVTAQPRKSGRVRQVGPPSPFSCPQV